MLRSTSNFIGRLKTYKTKNFRSLVSLGYHNFSFSSKMSKNQSFFRKNMPFTYWPITKHIVMTQLWSMPYSIVYHLPKKMRYRWTKSDKKWRQETRSKSTTNKKTPCISHHNWDWELNKILYFTMNYLWIYLQLHLTKTREIWPLI